MKVTSLEAYKNMQPKIPTDHQRILNILKSYSDLTYCEIADKLRFSNPNKISRRLPELVRLDKIEITGTKICPIAKSNCTTYKIKDGN